MNTYRRLLAFLRPHSGRFAGNVGANVVGAALDGVAFLLLIPFLNILFGIGNPIPKDRGWLTDLLNAVVGGLLDPADPMGSLGGVIAIIVGLVALKNVFLWLGGQLGASLQERITRDLRDAVFRHMLRLPLGWFSRNKTGQVMSRIISDTEQAKAVLAEVATRSVQNLAQVTVTIVLLVRMSPRLALLSLVVAPLITITIQPILRKLRRGHRALRNEYGEITSVLQEVVSGVRLVKSFRGEEYEDRRFTGASGGYTRFSDGADAGQAILIAYGGVSGGAGGGIRFEGASTGGSASVYLADNGELDLSEHSGGLGLANLDLAGGILRVRLGATPTSLTLSSALAMRGQACFAFEPEGVSAGTPYTLLSAPNLADFAATQFSGNSVNGLMPSFSIVGTTLQVVFG